MMSLKTSPGARAGVGPGAKLPKFYQGQVSGAQPSPGPRESSVIGLIWYLVATVLLAVLAQRSPMVSTAWALGALALGVATLGQRRSWDGMALVTAHIVGAELVWRGTEAGVFWEYGKYSLIVLFSLSLLRTVPGRRFEWRGLLYAACLLPSLAVLPELDRSRIAFNLSGPVALVLAVVFFAGRPVGRRLLFQICVSCLGPIVGLAAIATFGTLASDPNQFVVGQRLTTAGIGPNQVSSILGLGLVLIFVMVLLGPKRKEFRVLMAALGLWLGAQTMLSFSRGGFWAAIGAILVGAMILLQSKRLRWTIGATTVVVGMVFQFAILPATDRVTGGLVTRRFADFDMTGREEIMKADWIIFLENPVLGVGPGQSYEAHAMTYRASSAHTEFTRLLAEHGVFGALGMGVLIWMSWRRWRRKVPPISKGLSMAFTAWALLFMFHSAMRLSAPAFAFGLGGAMLVTDLGGRGDRRGGRRRHNRRNADSPARQVMDP